PYKLEVYPPRLAPFKARQIQSEGCARPVRAHGRRRMAVRVGINGFGRIGRNIMRAAMGNSGIDFVAVNDLTNAATLAHLLKYDSILGDLHGDISASGDKISVNKDSFQVLSIKDPAELAWKSLGG